MSLTGRSFRLFAAVSMITRYHAAGAVSCHQVAPQRLVQPMTAHTGNDGVSHHSIPVPWRSTRTTLAEILVARVADSLPVTTRVKCVPTVNASVVSMNAPLELTLRTQPLPLRPSRAEIHAMARHGMRSPQRCSMKRL
jgi:hypothetical protein